MHLARQRRTSIQTGKEAFDKVIGCNAWEWYRQHPDVMAVFNDTMRALSALITPAVTASCALEPVRSP